MAAIVSVVAIAFAAVLLSFADHQSTASKNDALRQRSIDASTAGLVVADSALTRQDAGSTYSGTVGDSASYSVTIATVPGAPFQRILTSVGSASGTVRKMQQVVELDPVAFTYGIFSETDLSDGPVWQVTGSLYTNGSIALTKKTNFIGDISARGNISVDSHTTVAGSLFANGTVTVTGKVEGSAYAGGTITTCSTATVTGLCHAHVLPLPVPSQHLPVFLWPNSQYPVGAYREFASGSLFSSRTAPRDAGVFHITGNVSLDTIELTGDMTIIASGDITLPRKVSKAASVGNAAVQLTVISTGGDVIPPNNFEFSVPTLVYTPHTFGSDGNVNSSVFLGAVYAGGVHAHANISFTYAPVKAPLGFDWSSANPQTFTIRHVSTKEITGGTG